MSCCCAWLPKELDPRLRRTVYRSTPVLRVWSYSWVSDPCREPWLLQQESESGGRAVVAHTDLSQHDTERVESSFSLNKREMIRHWGGTVITCFQNRLPSFMS